MVSINEKCKIHQYILHDYSINTFICGYEILIWVEILLVSIYYLKFPANINIEVLVSVLLSLLYIITYYTMYHLGNTRSSHILGSEVLRSVCSGAAQHDRNRSQTYSCSLIYLTQDNSQWERDTEIQRKKGVSIHSKPKESTTALDRQQTRGSSETREDSWVFSPSFILAAALWGRRGNKCEK